MSRPEALQLTFQLCPELNAEPGDRDEDTVVADIDGNGGGTLSIVAGHELPDNVNVCAPTKLNVAGPSAPAMAKITRNVARTRIRPRFGGGRWKYNARLPVMVVVRNDDMHD
ncbi:hypothetical protein K443DRAFT_131271 [Laccaria amethystina LaAM-08-1]|uniref:Uncharacterized protein n=1 Tax=Laccaria amethystina LaAM-08-1 TaxID=1095629 RepID=A0A0C9XPT0_9AGAR|nr:hypothetical protein K443DRAFT_131271 [Laccaria amethystina LaAM-08-1]